MKTSEKAKSENSIIFLPKKTVYLFVPPQGFEP